jgi:hypothetical protein
MARRSAPNTRGDLSDGSPTPPHTQLDSADVASAAVNLVPRMLHLAAVNLIPRMLHLAVALLGGPR